MPGYNQQPPRFIAYWLGYRSHTYNPNGPLTPALEAIPDFIDVVVLAFALVRPNNAVDPTFLFNPPNSAATIQAGIKTLQARGKKVLLSVGGYGGNCWATMTDTNVLADSIMQLVNAWGLDGIDIDYEGDNPLQDWMSLPACPNMPPIHQTQMLNKLILRLRDLLGLKRYLTAVTTGYDPYITDSMTAFNWVSTMDYGIEQAYGDLSAAYLVKYPDAKVMPFVLGVSCSQPTMDLNSVKQLCRKKSLRGTLSMMLWDLSEDNPAFSGQTLWTYANAIEQNLPGGPQHLDSSQHRPGGSNIAQSEKQ